MITPIFSSHHSIGDSILTSDPPEDIAEKPQSPVSIWSIAKKHDLKEVYIIDRFFSGFVEHYNNSEKLNIPLRFGVKFTICDKADDKSESSLKTESNIIVFARNSDGYKDLIKLYSSIHSNKEYFYYRARGDWGLLNRMMTDNLLLCFPFYTSFLARNLLEHSHRAIPAMKLENAVFFRENHNHPKDSLIDSALTKYCAAKYNILDAHSCYYYTEGDFKAFITYSCIMNRTTFNKPNLEFMCSNGFSFESYLKRKEKKS